MADWSSAGPARVSGAGRRRHWKLPDMIQGVRHRFRDKHEARERDRRSRSKSPDFSLEGSSNTTASGSSASYNGGGGGLPRAASMLSTDCGFGGGYPDPRPLTRAVHPEAGTREQRVPPITVSHHATSRGHPQLGSDCEGAARPGSSSRSQLGHRAASVAAVNQAGLSHSVAAPRSRAHAANGGSGKSVRFGENRISVFLQDSTQALEECVRLALSYAEESKRPECRGEAGAPHHARADTHYCSDSEAVTLSRALQGHAGVTSAPPPATHFWSDSEDRGGGQARSRADPRGHTSASSGPGCLQGPPTPTNYKPKSFGQAVSSLDRVERLDKLQQEKNARKKKSAQINEIFSFIDKILSGCDSGCNDQFCPFVRDQTTAPHPTSRIPSYSGSDWPTHNKTYRFNSSSVSSEYQSQAASSVPGGCYSAAASYAYNHQQGEPPSNAACAGWASDSDCDTSECSTLKGGRRPPRSRLRTDTAASGRSLTRPGSAALGRRTTEDVFAQIIICCESNKDSIGMPKYSHLHQKISQTVCNAIFLCKVCWGIVSQVLTLQNQL